MKCIISLSLIFLGVSLVSGETVENLSQRDTRMAWWRDAHFGMFVHWGLYSG